jgi:dienelactone hydrolase
MNDVVAPPAARAPARSKAEAVAVAAVVATTLALAYLVGRAGAAGWRLVRVAAVVGLGLAVLWAVRRVRPPARAIVEVVVGIVATAVGVGIGGPHLAKSGLSLITVAGLVTFAGGLVLLALGGATLVRCSRGWWKVPVVAGLVVLVLAMVRALAPAVAATNVPRTDLSSRTPADVGLFAVDVELSTSDGVVLSGWYLPSTNGAAAVLLHGAGSTRSAVLDHAAVVARHGYGVLLLDARGHGRSGGQAMDFGWHGDRDVGAAVDFLVARPDVDPGRIAAVGISMGGEEAIGAAAADDRIAAVVAEGATNRVAADRDWLSDEHGALGWLQEQLDWVMFSVADLLTSASPPIALGEAVAASGAPMLLVAAGDVSDERVVAERLQRVAPDRVAIWTVGGSPHGAALSTEPDAWEDHVVGFLDRELGAGA